MGVSMRPSRVLAKLRAGDIATCFKLNLMDARAAEIAAMAGFDCLWLCMEHVPNDLAAIEGQIRAAKMFDVDSIVRVARGSYSDYIRPLEADAAGIMVPHLMSLADARNVVRMTKFHPIGRRPVDGGNSDGAYCTIEFKEYIRQANEQRFVSVQIEDPEPLDELDAIAALPGIDMLFFGPADFSHGIGAPGEFGDPRVIEARKRIAEACIKHGKLAGTVATPESIDETIAMGYRFICMGADVIGLVNFSKQMASEFEKRRILK
jgi:4-hydroxy-2-oxoheptanedioate aldolase